MSGKRWRWRAIAVTCSAGTVLAMITAQGAASAAARPSTPSGACAASQLRVAVPSTGGMTHATMSTLTWSITYRNVGTQRCSLRGNPDVSVTVGHRAVPLTSSPVNGNDFGTVAARPIWVAPGQSAVVTVIAPLNANDCHNTWTVHTSVPGSSGQLSATVPGSPLAPCAGDRLEVSPAYPLNTLLTTLKALQDQRRTPVVSAPPCNVGRLSAGLAAATSSSASSVQELSLRNGTGRACTLPTYWPSLRLRGANGRDPVAKALPLPSPVLDAAFGASLAPYRHSDTFSLAPGSTASVVIASLTAGSCQRYGGALVYPTALATGSHALMRFAHPVTVCGTPYILPYLSGQPSAAALSTAGRALPAVASDMTHGVLPDGDSHGYVYGADSNAPGPVGSGPYFMPYYPDGYVIWGWYAGELGNYFNAHGCSASPYYGLNWVTHNHDAAQANATTYHDGMGGSLYWMMSGPGLDPSYGSGSAATSWGADQGSDMLRDIGSWNFNTPIIFEDIEDAWNTGWNEAWTDECGPWGDGYGYDYSDIPTSLDMDTYTGFANEVYTNSAYSPGVYCAPGQAGSSWADIFGDGTSAGWYEWTYVGATSSLSQWPSGWTDGSQKAEFFGAGITGSTWNATVWQWSGGGGVSSGKGDFDQFDVNHSV
jgi:hypothetical protein